MHSTATGARRAHMQPCAMCDFNRRALSGDWRLYILRNSRIFRSVHWGFRCALRGLAAIYSAELTDLSIRALGV